MSHDANTFSKLNRAKITRESVHSYSFRLHNKMQTKRRKIPVDILYKTYSTRYHFVQWFIIDLKFYYQPRSTKISLFRSEFAKRHHRFPTWPNGAKTEPSDLVSSQVPYPFSLVAHPSREIVFLFFWSDVISDRSVGLCHCVEILLNGFIRWNFESNYFKSDYFRKWLTGDSASSIGKSIISYLHSTLPRVFCIWKDRFGVRASSG